MILEVKIDNAETRLNELNIKYSVTFCGFNPDEKWPHFMWNILINGEQFNYKTGIGHTTSHYNENGKLNKKPQNSLNYNCEWLHVPKITDILDALFSDSNFGNESFDDFCENLGYSNDSLSALDVYRACMENGKKLKKCLSTKYDETFKFVNELQNLQ